MQQCFMGSSPRMRGTPSTNTFRNEMAGIIPAYAGNTSLPPVSRDCRRDHPRVCGEHEFVQQGDGRHWGSSPRMRGTQGLQRQDLSRHGIIPAYAGNTRA